MHTQYRRWCRPNHSMSVSTTCFKCISQNELSTLRTATKQPLSLDGSILQKICLGDLHAQTWLGINPRFAVDSLLGTTFTDCFNCGIFLLIRKIVLWHYKSVPIKIRPLKSWKLFTIDPKALPISLHSTLTAPGVIKISDVRSVYIIARKVLHRQAPLRKCMITAHTAKPPSVYADDREASISETTDANASFFHESHSNYS